MATVPISDDDMVIWVKVADEGQGNAPREQHRQDVVDKVVSRKRKGLGEAIARKIRRKAAKTAVGLARRAVGIRLPPANPIAVGVAVLIVAGLVAGRLMSGRSFEGMGQDLRKTIFGNLSADAIAKQSTREAFESNDALMMIAGREGISKPMRMAFDQIYQLNKTEAEGRLKLLGDRDLQVNNMADMLILSMRTKLLAAFKSLGGDQAVTDAENALQHRMRGGVYL